MNLVLPETGLLFWMTLIFGIVFFLLWKFGFPIITDMVDKRSAHIDSSLKLAQEAEERMRDLAKEQAALIEQTRSEQTRILREATQTKAQIISQAKIEARAEASKLLEKAKTEIAAEKESALRDIRKEIALLSVNVAEKVIRDRLSSDDAQMEFLSKMVEEIATSRDIGNKDLS